MDKGTETTEISTMHAFLRQSHGDLDNACDSVIYGPSTSTICVVTQSTSPQKEQGILVYYGSAGPMVKFDFTLL